MLTGIAVRLLGAWADIALAVLLLAVWAYGDITGKGSERQKNEIEKLTNTVKILTEQRDTTLAIQTKMAETMSDLRLKVQARKDQVSVVVEQIKAAPSSGACLLSDAQRLRLRTIRIGSPTVNPRPR